MSDIEVEGQFFVPSGNCFFCLPGGRAGDRAETNLHARVGLLGVIIHQIGDQIFEKPSLPLFPPRPPAGFDPGLPVV